MRQNLDRDEPERFTTAKLHIDARQEKSGRFNVRIAGRNRLLNQIYDDFDNENSGPYIFLR